MGSTTPSGTSPTKQYFSGNPPDVGVSQTPRSLSTFVPTTSTSTLLSPSVPLAHPTVNIRNVRWFQRHDSTFSVTDDYQYPSSNDLNVWNGAALLCADCLGTGLLALPHDITVVLGSAWGLFFLILQLPINLYAGSILSDAALYVETRQANANHSNVSSSIPLTDNTTSKNIISEHDRLWTGNSYEPQTTSAIINPNNDSVNDYQAVSTNVDKDMGDENRLLVGEDNNEVDNNHHHELHRESDHDENVVPVKLLMLFFCKSHFQYPVDL
jgi:hypothetical protein